MSSILDLRPAPVRQLRVHDPRLRGHVHLWGRQRDPPHLQPPLLRRRLRGTDARDPIHDPGQEDDSSAGRPRRGMSREPQRGFQMLLLTLLFMMFLMIIV